MIDQYLLPAPDLSSKPAPVAAAAVDRRDRQTDGRILERFMTLTTYYADRIKMRPTKTLRNYGFTFTTVMSSAKVCLHFAAGCTTGCTTSCTTGCTTSCTTSCTTGCKV